MTNWLHWLQVDSEIGSLSVRVWWFEPHPILHSRTAWDSVTSRYTLMQCKRLLTYTAQSKSSCEANGWSLCQNPWVHQWMKAMVKQEEITRQQKGSIGLNWWLDSDPEKKNEWCVPQHHGTTTQEEKQTTDTRKHYSSMLALQHLLYEIHM